ncbi:DEAD/DEAH box helicase [Bacteroides xylanisolvens]|uniref:DEAD/DEAH box helicase n=1 Tax=Bacteroides xylanisolvens TaxID=371601 RepID=UPI001C8B8B50|nr:DEAD/DEAH box helicase [Bacteroides xylanisolvens]
MIPGTICITKYPNCYTISFPYHPMLVTCVKRIPSVAKDIKKAYLSDEKAWKIEPQDESYVKIMADWAIHYGYCNRKQWRESTRNLNDYSIPEMPKLEIPHGLLLEPYDYQKEGIAYALKYKRCIFGDQPGLGKTLQAIGTVTIAKSYPCLVICPAALKINWQREFKKFAGKQALILDDRNKGSWQRYIETKCCDIFITNYESLKKYFVLRVKDDARFTMKSIEFDPRISLFRSVIIDESHKCKSTKTQQSKFVEGICKGKEYILELTGTPVVNDNTDLIQQLKIMGRLEDFGGYKFFVDRYCDGLRKSSNLRELNWRLWNTCFFRREKSKVLTQLPDKSRQYIEVDISTRREYEKAENDLIQYLRDYKNASDEKITKAMRGEVMVRMGILKSISARGKIKVFSEFIHDVIDGGEKLIVFAYLKDVVHELKKLFPDAVLVTGDENPTQKQISVDRFQNDPSCKLIILNYKSGGTGLTLTASSRVAFIEFPWTFSDCEQAEDRAHRNGQKNNVNCYYYLGKDTIDRYMYDVIQTKKSIANGVTGTDDVVKENMVDMAMNLFSGRL